MTDTNLLQRMEKGQTQCEVVEMRQDYVYGKATSDSSQYSRVGVKYSTCTWYLYLSTYSSVLDVLEYLVYGNVKVLVLVLDHKVLST